MNSEQSAGWLPSDADLVDYYYGESDRAKDIEQALAHSPALAERYVALEALLGAVRSPVVPELPVEWEADLWHRLAPALQRAPNTTARGWLRSAGLSAVAASLLIAAFLVGRSHGRDETRAANGTMAQGFSQESRDRLLLAAAIDHLDRSEVFLVNMKNQPGTAPGTEPGAAFAEARTRAAELVVSNRLLRRSLSEDRAEARNADAGGPPASRAGLAAVLEDLEPVLLEIAHAPDTLSSSDLDLLRARLRERGTLLKLRAVQGRLQREQTPVAPRSGPRA